MSKYNLSSIYTYPIKSLGEIKLESAIVERRGLKYDRRWMLVDKSGMFITQRKYPEMALLQVEIKSNGLKVSHKIKKLSPLDIPFETKPEKLIDTTIWNDRCPAVHVSNHVDKWFSSVLRTKCRLVYMPDKTERRVNPKYSSKENVVSFADGFPFLLIGEESLNLLNKKLKHPVSLNRFRPNIVFSGGEPHDEDNWKEFRIGDVIFNAVKPCARCVITTIDQTNAIKSREPLETLSTYRKKGNKVLFGQNLVHKKAGNIKAGDSIKIINFNESDANT
jgi:uncharacterized protein YcbX